MNAELRRLTKALIFAAEAHRNQRRKGAAQEPYLNHLVEVLERAPVVVLVMRDEKALREPS